MSVEQQKLEPKRPYIADGIEEFDNPMPSWWLGLFYATIIFSIIYIFAYHVFRAPSLEEEFSQDTQHLLEQKTNGKDTPPQEHGPGSEPTAPAVSLKEKLKSKDLIAKGKDVFMTNCAPCHGNLGEGGIGPNLTDEYWIHGGKEEDIIKTISNGVLEKGMISWLPILGPEKTEEVAAYTLSLQGTNPPKAKAAEGAIYKRQD
ncbi:MAG: c-type cytochrome [Oligoflexales bacterium]|nr:c-type cytochrome [Oligoflexales bacterium]